MDARNKIGDGMMTASSQQPIRRFTKYDEENMHFVPRTAEEVQDLVELLGMADVKHEIGSSSWNGRFMTRARNKEIQLTKQQLTRNVLRFLWWECVITDRFIGYAFGIERDGIANRRKTRMLNTRIAQIEDMLIALNDIHRKQGHLPQSGEEMKSFLIEELRVEGYWERYDLNRLTCVV